MARRNLLAEAQVTAAAQVAPQISALQVALQTARADRNSAIHAAATAYKGLSGAIHRAGPQQRQVFSGAQRSAAGSDAIAHQTLGGLASSPGVDTIKAAYAHEGAVGGAVIAKALASRLADLSDKRIASAAGRAYQVSNANANYSAAAAKNAQQMQGVAQQQGLLTGANYSKLTEAAAGRKNQRLMQQRSITSSQTIAADNRAAADARAQSSQSFQAHQNALSRRASRRNTVFSQSQQNKRAAMSAGGSKKTGGLTPNQVAVAGEKHKAAVTDPLDAVTTQILAQKGRSDPHSIRQSLLAPKDKKVAPVPISLVNAAMDLAYNGYLSKPNQQVVGSMLKAHGVDQIPKRYLPVTVQPHVRRPRRSK